MANKSTDTNNDMPEVVKKSWLPFSLILTITGAITAIYNFIKLWQGDQRLITTIMVVAGLIVSIAILLQVSFSKIPEKENSASLKRHNKTKSIYSYKPLIRYTAQAMLIAILLATIGGVFFLAKQNADLEKKLIIVIATFDGPEEDYGMRNQIVEELNKSLVNLSNVKIVAISEVITPTQDRTKIQQIGKQYLADIVIWGWYRATQNPNLTLHIENLSHQEFSILEESNTITPNSKLSDLESFTLQQQIGKEARNLIYFLEGYVQYQASNYKSAISHFDQSLNEPNWFEGVSINKSDVYYFRGICYGNLHNYNQAISDFSKAIEISPEFSEAYVNRSWTYSLMSEYNSALADINQAIQINPLYARAYDSRAYIYLQLNKTDLAINDYSKMIEINPKTPSAYNNRGFVYYNLGNIDKAVSDYNQAIQINPNSAETYNNRGLAYRSINNTELAIADFNKAIEINPRDYKALYNRGRMYEDGKQYDLAIADFNQVININPQDRDAYYNRGYVYYEMGKYNQAISDYTQAMQIDPTFANAYIERGTAYTRINKYEQAILDYNQAQQLEPLDPIIYLNRGDVYKLLGQREKAEADFKKYTELTGIPIQ